MPSALRLACLALAALAGAAPRAAPQVPPADGAAPAVRLQEFDPDQPGADRADFVELAAPAGTPLDEVFLALYDGGTAAAYEVVDLYGQRVGPSGCFVIGSPRVPGVHLLALGGDGLQNGPDGLALWHAPGARAADLLGRGPREAPAGALLLDAVVYGGAAPALSAALGLPDAGARLIDTGAPAFSRAPGDDRPRVVDAFAPAPPSPGVLSPRAVLLRPHDLQGAGHLSPFTGQTVRDVEGVVTALRRDGFHLQTLPGEEDADPATSEALRVVLESGARPSVGDHLRLSGQVREHRPGGRASDLPRTQLHVSGGLAILARDTELPEPERLGPDGRAIPDRVIDDDSPDGRVGADTPFDPEHCGLDFWESLEGMRVELPRALVVGPTTRYGEIPVILAPAEGERPAGLGPDSRLRRLADDPQPELLLLDDTLERLPALTPGARFDSPVRGVLDHDFGAFRLLVQPLPEPRPAPPTAAPPARAPPSADLLRVATYNLRNLHAGDDPARIAELARQIVGPLGAPQVLAIQEVQDDSGPRDDGVTSARRTLAALTAAVRAAGGPDYTALCLDPVDGADGGRPGANIRVALLVDTARGVTFAARPPAASGSRASLVRDAQGAARLQPNPALLEPGHSAWTRSRKPLVVELDVSGRALFVVVVHFASRSGDPSLFDAVQPHVSHTAEARRAQAALVGAFADRLAALDPSAALLVLGDLNTFEDAPEMALLRAGRRLELLTERIPPEARGTYLFQGRTQTLDHVLASPGLLGWASSPRVTHLPLNTPRADAPSDHDPVLVDFVLGPRGAAPGALGARR